MTATFVTLRGLVIDLGEASTTGPREFDRIFHACALNEFVFEFTPHVADEPPERCGQHLEVLSRKVPVVECRTGLRQSVEPTCTLGGFLCPTRRPLELVGQVIAYPTSFPHSSALIIRILLGGSGRTPMCDCPRQPNLTCRQSPDLAFERPQLELHSRHVEIVELPVDEHVDGGA